MTATRKIPVPHPVALVAAPGKVSKAAVTFGRNCFNAATETPEQLERHRRITVHMSCICMMWIMSVVADISFLVMVSTIMPVTLQELIDYSTRDYREWRL
jgi:hypothetical protein